MLKVVNNNYGKYESVFDTNRSVTYRYENRYFQREKPSASTARDDEKFSAVFTDFFKKKYLFTLTVFRIYSQLPPPTDVIDEFVAIDNLFVR